ncbi:hypothetical protein NI389_19100 (plasmid) [Pseudoalteromonas xiamenensis]|uniref:hypothetical protein n=1 Tax=Pseudoalteromonas xiamenensis TaxID=882626 RepID=UPI0027E3D806|nr:hypothetical protein [Pseudoalteromonas xiamenensis]WMN61913.1 hypothetical protein NI389_19100 [Pseudoalteromonas xiamenensis]
MKKRALVWALIGMCSPAFAGSGYEISVSITQGDAVMTFPPIYLNALNEKGQSTFVDCTYTATLEAQDEQSLRLDAEYRCGRDGNIDSGKLPEFVFSRAGDRVQIEFGEQGQQYWKYVATVTPKQ